MPRWPGSPKQAFGVLEPWGSVRELSPRVWTRADPARSEREALTVVGNADAVLVDRRQMKEVIEKQLANEDYQRFLSKVPRIEGVWDDHDYGGERCPEPGERQRDRDRRDRDRRDRERETGGLWYPRRDGGRRYRCRYGSLPIRASPRVRVSFVLFWSREAQLEQKKNRVVCIRGVFAELVFVVFFSRSSQVSPLSFRGSFATRWYWREKVLL